MKVVTDGSADAPEVSLRAYARHRGVRLSAVQKAIASGRLVASVVRKRGAPLKIASLEAADREWNANTNATKATPSLLAKVARTAAAPPPAAPPSTPPAAPAAPDEPRERMSLLDASALEKEWKAKLAELEYRKQVGELVNAHEVESRLVETFTRCRTKLLGVPGKLKTAIPSLTRQQIVIAEQIVREALEDLTVPEATKGIA